MNVFIYGSTSILCSDAIFALDIAALPDIHFLVKSGIPTFQCSSLLESLLYSFTIFKIVFKIKVLIFAEP